MSVDADNIYLFHQAIKEEALDEFARLLRKDATLAGSIYEGKSAMYQLIQKWMSPRGGKSFAMPNIGPAPVLKVGDLEHTKTAWYESYMFTLLLSPENRASLASTINYGGEDEEDEDYDRPLDLILRHADSRLEAVYMLYHLLSIDGIHTDVPDIDYYDPVLTQCLRIASEIDNMAILKRMIPLGSPQDLNEAFWKACDEGWYRGGRLLLFGGADPFGTLTSRWVGDERKTAVELCEEKGAANSGENQDGCLVQIRQFIEDVSH